MGKLKRFILAGGLLGLIGAATGWQVTKAWFLPVGKGLPWVLEITPDSVRWSEGEAAEHVRAALALRSWKARPGRYTFRGDETGGEAARRVASGERDAVRIVLPAHRDIGVIAGRIAEPLWVDSAAVDAALREDSIRWLIRPNSYDVYWETSVEGILKRIAYESGQWWTPERREQAQAWGLTPEEAVILASIVQEESANLSEAPRIAGLYLNRLRRGMLLQADPTLKFALGDWGIRRLLSTDKDVDSPYNTYQHKGLPPGPIRIPESAFVDAVLRAETHSYLYMCARPDDSGLHNFATGYAAHKRNAQAYRNMLNRRGVYR